MVIQRSRGHLKLAQAEKIPKEDQESSSKYKMRLFLLHCFSSSPTFLARAAIALTSPSCHIMQNIAMFKPWS